MQFTRAAAMVGIVLLTGNFSLALADVREISGAFETTHQYANNTNDTWVLKTSSQRIRVHFSQFSTEPTFDYVVLTDAGGEPLTEHFTGELGDFWTPWLDAATISIQFVSNATQTRYGFEVDQIEAEQANLINVNLANVSELTALKGIGVVTATNIIESRDNDGWLVNKNELLDVTGIGPATLRDIQDDVTTRFDVNRADQSTLQKLNGIGPELAARIVEHRNTFGPFTSKEDLLRVTGIEIGALNAIADFIDVTVKTVNAGLLNFNTANQQQLEGLKGIGPVTATNIIQFRAGNGWFVAQEDILAVSGIGSVKLNGFKDNIYLAIPGIVLLTVNAPTLLALPEGEVHLYTEDAISIAAFNVQVFGVSKMEKPAVVATLTSIVRRYDIILIQEIRDASGQAIQSLLDLVNDYNGPQYELLISDRLGRTVSKEQYAFLFRNARVQLLDSFHYDDGQEPANDTFQREPFVALFEVGEFQFATVAIHTDPDEVFAELTEMRDVFDDILDRFGVNNVLIMGDFNADCNYLRSSEKDRLALRQDAQFTWYIDDAVDTTTSATNCAYDRFVGTAELSTRLIPGSAQTFRFDQLYQLDNTLTKQVSDHYPIEMGLTLQ